jgi:hypothetical protein
VSQPHLCLLGDANSVHLQRWAREMIVRGFHVSVVTARPQPIEGVEQCVLSPVRRSVDWLRRVGEARRFVERLAPDIVHAHYISSYGYLAARCARHPLVMTAWGSDLLLTPRYSTLMRWLTGWTLRRADLITGDSLDLVAAVKHPVAVGVQNGERAAAKGHQFVDVVVAIDVNAVGQHLQVAVDQGGSRSGIGHGLARFTQV